MGRKIRLPKIVFFPNLLYLFTKRDFRPYLWYLSSRTSHVLPARNRTCAPGKRQQQTKFRCLARCSHAAVTGSDYPFGKAQAFAGKSLYTWPRRILCYGGVRRGLTSRFPPHFTGRISGELAALAAGGPRCGIRVYDSCLFFFLFEKERKRLGLLSDQQIAKASTAKCDDLIVHLYRGIRNKRWRRNDCSLESTVIKWWGL